MENKNICPICGKPTRKYMGNYRKDLLCGYHADLLKENKLKYENNEYYILENDEWNKINNQSIKQTIKCIVCGKEQNQKICTKCLHEINDKIDEIDKNQKSWELKDYYYNLHSSIYRLKTYDIVESQIKKLFAIAHVNNLLYKDSSLINRVEEDAIKLLKSKESLKENKINNNLEQNDKTIIATTNLNKNRAADGHICKSQQEAEIDNILFDKKICHAYERRVKEIPSTERTITADWFIPLSGTKGIYIEYWGMDTDDYEENKREKLKLYEKYKDKVKLIEIQKEDVNDRQNLEDYLFEKLTSYGWDPDN